MICWGMRAMKKLVNFWHGIDYEKRFLLRFYQTQSIGIEQNYGRVNYESKLSSPKIKYAPIRLVHVFDQCLCVEKWYEPEDPRKQISDDVQWGGIIKDKFHPIKKQAIAFKLETSSTMKVFFFDYAFAVRRKLTFVENMWTLNKKL